MAKQFFHITLLLVLAFVTEKVFAGTSNTATLQILSNGKPIASATVKINGQHKLFFSDAGGICHLQNIEPGSYTLTITAIGYTTITQQITIAANATKIITIQLEETSKELEEVVVTGTLKPVTMANSPVCVQVYNAGFFQKNASNNLFNALEMVNGLRPQNICNVCNTGDIRINGLEGAYTMVTIDGMPIVSALGTVYGFNGIPMSMIERVEIVKGPVSTLYGSEAVAGVINIITKNPLKAPRFSIDISSSSYLEHNADVSMSVANKKFHWMQGINLYSFNKRWDLNADNFTDLSTQNRFSVFNKLKFTRKENRDASIAVRYLYEDRFGGQLNWNKQFRGGDSVYGESIYTNRLELLGNYDVSIANEKIKFQLSYNLHQQNSVYGTTVYMGKQQIGFGQLIWDKKINERHDALFGASIRYNHYDDNTPITPTANRVVMPGVFAQDEISFGTGKQLLVGARWDYHSQHGNILAPRINYKWSINEHHTLRIAAGNGFRVVNLFTEDHAALTGARQLVIEGNLKPEKSYNINANLLKHIHWGNTHINMELSAFYNYFTNKIIPDYLTNSNQVIYRNLNGAAISRGISVNMDIKSSLPLTLNAGFTYMDVFQRDIASKEKTPIVQMPNITATWAAGYRFTRSQLMLDITGNYTGSMFMPVVENDTRPTKSPAFSIVNLQLSKQIKDWQLSVGIKNLFNYLPIRPVLRPADPFDKNLGSDFGNPQVNPVGASFDPNYSYAAMQGIRFFMGCRFKLGK